MGNKASNESKGKEEESCRITSCSTPSLATQPAYSDDEQLCALVEATAQQQPEEPNSKPNNSPITRFFNALFAPSPTKEVQSPQLPPIKVRLCHCETDDEHRAYITQLLDRVKDLHGEEGLREAGFEFKRLYCPEHEPVGLHNDDDTSTQEEKKCDVSLGEEDNENENASNVSLEMDQHIVDEFVTRTSVLNGVSMLDNKTEAYKPCFQCATRLYYCQTNTLITEENRRLYIADGEMYEEVTRLAQECAQQAMQREGNLEWVTVCDDPTHSNPVRALVHEDHHLVSDSREDTADDHPTLLIATGKGKVKAGVFSRKFLLTAGMESSTALPMVMEAAQRQMSVVIFDPNARGDRQGMDTFENSFNAVLGHLDHCSSNDEEHHQTEENVPSKRALYIVAHSASGSQLVRYMLDRVHGYLPYLRAIAFTDSTHNIQWTRKNAALQSLLASKKCVYFRSASKAHDDGWYNRKAGDAVETDSFWKHRFGAIKTLWAGTEEHSLMNWFAHVHIWSHFDDHMDDKDTEQASEEAS